MLLALVLACGSNGDDPHVLGTCTDWTDTQGNPFEGQCEAACAKPPTTAGEPCDTRAQLNCNSFEFGDVRGCCVQDPMMGPIRFHECE